MCQLQVNAGFFRQLATIAAHLPNEVADGAVVKIVMQKNGITVYDQKKKQLAFIPEPKTQPSKQ